MARKDRQRELTDTIRCVRESGMGENPKNHGGIVNISVMMLPDTN